MRKRLAYVLGLVSALSVAFLVAVPGTSGAASGPSDIVMANVIVSPAEVFTLDSVSIVAFVRNAGPRASGPVTVTVTLPNGLETEPVDLDPTWTCSSSPTTWTCIHAGIGPGEEIAETLVVGAKVVGGVPGDVLVVTASAEATNRDLRRGNNSGQASVKVVAPALISGIVWNDLDRDGQREAGEPPVSSGPDGIQVLRLIPPATSDLVPVDGVVASDGTYSFTVRPSQYVLQAHVDDSLFSFTQGDVGDDATDSDLVFFEGDPGVRVGTSEDINLESGSVTTNVDIGLVTLSLP